MGLGFVWNPKKGAKGGWEWKPDPGEPATAPCNDPDNPPTPSGKKEELSRVQARKMVIQKKSPLMIPKSGGGVHYVTPFFMKKYLLWQAHSEAGKARKIAASTLSPQEQTAAIDAAYAAAQKLRGGKTSIPILGKAQYAADWKAWYNAEKVIRSAKAQPKAAVAKAMQERSYLQATVTWGFRPVNITQSIAHQSREAGKTVGRVAAASYPLEKTQSIKVTTELWRRDVRKAHRDTLVDTLMPDLVYTDYDTVVKKYLTQSTLGMTIKWTWVTVNPKGAVVRTGGTEEEIFDLVTSGGGMSAGSAKNSAAALRESREIMLYTPSGTVKPGFANPGKGGHIKVTAQLMMGGKAARTTTMTLTGY